MSALDKPPSPATAKDGLRGKVIIGLTISGVILSAGVLILSGCMAFHSRARRHLDRVSFRLLVYTLAAHIVFGVLGPVTDLYLFPGWQCSFLAFVVNVALLFSAALFFCMALNLVLVLVYNINGRKMEKYYVLGSALVSAICLGSAYACDQLGWDDKNKICWYGQEDSPARLSWVVGTQMFWMLLFAIGELVAFLIIVGHLLVYMFPMRKDPSESPSVSSRCSQATSRGAGLTIVAFRGIILRIGIYPLVSCITNLTSTFLSIYQLKHQPAEGAPLSGSGAMPLLLGLSIYAARPLIYGAIAITDPSFIRALRALRRRPRLSSVGSTSTGTQTTSACLTTVLTFDSELLVDSNASIRTLPFHSSSRRGAGNEHELGFDTWPEERRSNGSSMLDSDVESVRAAPSTIQKEVGDTGDVEHGLGVELCDAPGQRDVARHI
ncbi:hypothetical protein FB45DRAFT_844716 [Roridomyces roridus]|uniref:Uncharacterized protein n=1 Tax=Roridomyces roridus TaxID=1738132 RepID=A0AAD7B450_9AGAR|nr:hypothetical protein FB45DRAFT_844716 [Roridomyces roridus]